MPPIACWLHLRIAEHGMPYATSALFPWNGALKKVKLELELKFE